MDTIIERRIGDRILEVLKEKKMTRAQLARAAGISSASVSYLMNRTTIDVMSLVRVSRVLKHNFLKYYYTEEDGQVTLDRAKSDNEKDKTIEALKGKIAELEKEIAEMNRKMEMMKMEDEYLKKINSLLEKKF